MLQKREALKLLLHFVFKIAKTRHIVSVFLFIFKPLRFTTSITVYIYGFSLHIHPLRFALVL